ARDRGPRHPAPEHGLSLAPVHVQRAPARQRAPAPAGSALAPMAAVSTASTSASGSTTAMGSDPAESSGTRTSPAASTVSASSGSSGWFAVHPPRRYTPVRLSTVTETSTEARMTDAIATPSPPSIPTAG